MARAPVGRLHDERSHLIMGGKRSLRLPLGFKAPLSLYCSRLPANDEIDLFPPPGVSARYFASVSKTFVLAMVQARCNFAFGGFIRAKSGRHHNKRRAPTFQKLEQKPAGRSLISPRLDENVEDIHWPPLAHALHVLPGGGRRASSEKTDH